MATLFLISILLAAGVAMTAACYWGERVFGDRALGAVLLAIFASMLGLGLEHFIAIPQPLLFTAALALGAYGVWLLKTEYAASLRPGALILVAAFFLYPLAWRWAFPSISPSSERVTDLFFITHFIDGGRLPGIDRWLPPFAFDFYYPLQYYWAGLMVRVLRLPPGYAYNLGAVALMGAAGYLIWRVAFAQSGARTRAALITAALILGGSGAAPYIAVKITGHPRIDPGQVTLRAITTDARFSGGGGTGLLAQAPPADAPIPPELPLEPFAYQYYLGDFHPTLLGLLIGFALIAAMFAFEAPGASTALRKRLAFALGALPVICISANTWIFPLAALTVAFWTGWNLLRGVGRSSDMPAPLLPGWPLIVHVAIGGGAAMVISLPVLMGLASRQLATPMLFVTGKLHSPLVPWLMQWWPIVGLVIGALALLPRRSLGVFLALNTILLLAFSEFAYINDLSINQYERTNSVLKWWGWIWSVSMFGVGTAVLTDKRKLSLVLVAILLVPTLTSSYWYARYWISFQPNEAGKLAGTYLYTRDPAQREIVQYLQSAPPGIALESIAGNAYTDTGVLSLFGNKPSYLGWPDHEYTWRGGLGEVATRVDQIGKLYKRQLPDALEWLRSQQIEYILWLARDCRTYGDKGAWELNDQIRADYRFRINGWSQQCPIGVWTRLPSP
jgi:uncharacterized membrane protein